MKNLILITATLVFSLTTVNATNLKTNNNPLKSSTIITENDLIEIYDWTVKTTTGEFSGTATSLFDAKKRVNIIGQNEIVLEQKINTYYVLKSELQSQSYRVFFWEVKSKKAYAKGFASNEFDAKRIIHTIAKGDIVSYRVIASGDAK